MTKHKETVLAFAMIIMLLVTCHFQEQSFYKQQLASTTAERLAAVELVKN
jgi:hypothetical protein